MKNLIKLFVAVILLTGFTFTQEIPDKNMWYTNGPVYAIAVDGGSTYIGGNFSYVGPYTGNGVKLTTTSTVPATNFPKVNGIIRTAVPDGNGGWYIGGEFTKVGSFDRNNIAHINSNGTVNPTWNPNPDGSVLTIAISGSDIYVGGSLGLIGGQTRNYIAKLDNLNGDADATWNPDPNGNVVTIAISGSDIYVGGFFSSIGGQTRNNIAKLNNTTGTADANWNPNPNDFIQTITLRRY